MTNQLPEDILNHILGFVPRDRDMKSPTAMLMERHIEQHTIMCTYAPIDEDEFWDSQAEWQCYDDRRWDDDESFAEYTLRMLDLEANYFGVRNPYRDDYEDDDED